MRILSVVISTEIQFGTLDPWDKPGDDSGVWGYWPRSKIAMKKPSVPVRTGVNFR